MSPSTVVQLVVTFGVPCLVAASIWHWCRRPIGRATFALIFLFGATVVFPVIRLGNWIEPSVAGLAGHFYVNELIMQLLAVAIPEELGKGLVALGALRFLRMPASPAVWLSCGAAAYGGFAALEGALGALANEGLLKTLAGHSIGACLHCSWGIITAWFAWNGWRRAGYRAWSWPFALLVPVVLHAVGNASLLDAPDNTKATADEISLAEVMVMLSGIGAGLITAVLAGFSLCAARRTHGQSE